MKNFNTTLSLYNCELSPLLINKPSPNNYTVQFPSLISYHLASSDKMPHKRATSPLSLEGSSPPIRANKFRKQNDAMSISSLLSPSNSSNLPNFNPSSYQPNLASLPSLTCSPNSHQHVITSSHSTPERLHLPSTHSIHPNTPTLSFSRTFPHVTPETEECIHPPSTPLLSFKKLPEVKLSNTKSITIDCFHAVVAQKSYGNEKRFICPPPIVRSNPANTDHSLQKSYPIRLSLTSPSGSIGAQQDGHLNSKPSSFRYLHVTGDKAKSFQLKLDIFDEEFPECDQPKTSMLTKPISIISKPSKSKSLNACIKSGSLISLYSRINSQSVRTSYLKIENQLELSISKNDWSPMIIELVDEPNSSNPITYGSFITLKDYDNGFRSDIFQILKVQNGLVLPDYQGPVLQMNKIALKKIDTNECMLLSSTFKVNEVSNFPSPTPCGKLVNRLECIKVSLNDSNDKIKSYNAMDQEVWTLVGVSHSKHTF